MKWVQCHGGALQVRSVGSDGKTSPGDWNAWSSGEALARRAVHELLFDPALGHPPPAFPALLLARGKLEPGESSALVWCDPQQMLYPPAVASAGIPLDRLYLIRPNRAVDALWAAAESLRCPGVAAVIALLPQKLSRVEARRLQLAAEHGGGVGLMLRPVGKGKGADIYAAATRWLISPAPGERGVQRWRVQLVHGHGRHLGQSFLLESRRANSAEFSVEPLPLHPSAPLVDRAASPPAARVTA